jgi:hypothetical protein
MTKFYYNKYYSRKGNDNRFYIPLKSVKVDLNKLRNEVNTIIKPESGGYGITTAVDYVKEYPCNFKRYSSISYLNSEGERILPCGRRDEEIIHWPDIFDNSYIKELGNIFSELINIKNPRVRLSCQPGSIDYHNDPHTPYRIHIAIESNPDAIWKFKEKCGTEHSIYQPADGVPVLIETGITKHAVIMPARPVIPRRVHLWYQFHDIISDEILKSL